MFCSYRSSITKSLVLICSNLGRSLPRCSYRAAGMSTDSSKSFYDGIRCASGAFKYYVNGQWVESSSGRTVNNQDPCTNQTAFTMQGTHQHNEMLPWIF